MEACHGKGGKDDNSLANLRWDTKQVNESDKVADGAVLQGGTTPAQGSRRTRCVKYAKCEKMTFNSTKLQQYLASRQPTRIGFFIA